MSLTELQSVGPEVDTSVDIVVDDTAESGLTLCDHKSTVDQAFAKAVDNNEQQQRQRHLAAQASAIANGVQQIVVGFSDKDQQQQAIDS